ncbi:MAG TPA: Ppx/GppA phosphatase family protein [Candidatus Eisenbacteria bacterium]|nr:Ppx/GppA phosphatase family protein [Candidatus Eisenbacteria bacterium]
MHSPRPRFAAVDVGTNSIRLLVVEEREGRLEPLLRLGESCRLGEGLDAQGIISRDAEERASRTLGRFLRRARSLGPRRIGIAATHALRSAENGVEVAERLSRGVGVPVEILSAEEEALFVYEAAREALGAERLPEPCLVMDIGGGSVELVRGEGGRVKHWLSLEVGCVRLTERFLPSDPPAAAELERLGDHVSKALEGHQELLQGVTGGAGVGGTLTALAALDLGLERYEASRVEGHELSQSAIEFWSDRLAGMSRREREAMAAVGSGRSDIIVGGCAVVLEVIRRSGLSRLVVSTQGLRYALVRRLATSLSPTRGAGD